MGAATVDMDQIQIHPTVQFDTAALITEGLRGDGAILVNAEGKRFTDEVGTRGRGFRRRDRPDRQLQLAGGRSGHGGCLQRHRRLHHQGPDRDRRGLRRAGRGHEGVDAETFTATMEAWNACVESKTDEEFGRTSFANPLNTAPYYAIKVDRGHPPHDGRPEDQHRHRGAHRS